MCKKESKMRFTIVAAAVAAPLFFGATPSQAQTIYPWCLKATMGEDYSVDLCYFQTFERCAQERIAYGTTSFCIVNPQYYFRYGEPGQPQRRTKRGEAR
jgi:hypothetical protein